MQVEAEILHQKNQGKFEDSAARNKRQVEKSRIHYTKKYRDYYEEMEVIKVI